MPDKYFQTIATTQDRRAARPGVQEPFSFELTGVDSNTEGGLRPFPGFKTVHYLGGLNPAWKVNGTEQVVEVFCRSFLIGESSYGYGFVYRVRRKDGATGTSACDVYMDYYSAETGRWYFSESVKAGIPLPPEMDPVDGRQMSVSVWGRFIYVFIEDYEPRILYASPPLGYLTVLSNTGPGKRPALISPENGVALGSITDTEGKPGKGQVYLTEYKPSEVGLGLGSGTDTEGSSGTFIQQADDATVLLEPGDYAFAYILYNSENGRRSALSEIAQVRKSDFDPDASGPADPVSLRAALEICWDPALYDQAYVYRSVRVQSAGGTFVAGILHLDNIIDLEGYKTSNNPLGNGYDQAVYWYELEDKQLVFQDVFTDRSTFDEDLPKGGASFWYENTMLVSTIRSPSASSTEENRKFDAIRGVGELRWSSLVYVGPEMYPPENRYIPDLPSNSMVGFRQVGPNVIGFSRERPYMIRKEGTDLKVVPTHEGYGATSQHTIETVGSLVYFLSDKGMKAVDSTGQLDDVRSINSVILEDWAGNLDRISMAYDPTVSVLFILNPDEKECYLQWFNTGGFTRLEDMRFRFCARGRWPSGFELDVADLATVTPGSTNDTYKNFLQERVFFFDNKPGNTSSDTTGAGNWFWRVYVVDYLRERVQDSGLSAGEARRTMLPFEGDSIFEVSVNFSGTTVNVSVPGSMELSTDVIGCQLYVVEASDPELIGKRATILNRTTSTSMLLLSSEASQLAGLRSGDKVGISPVLFRWVGWPTSFLDPQTNMPVAAFDYRWVQHIDSLGPTFSDVLFERSELVDRAVFKGLVYKGSEDTPSYEAVPRDGSIQENEATYYASMGTNTAGAPKYGVEGVVLTPGIQVAIPDIDFRLLGIIVTGESRSTSRTRRA